MEKELIDKLIVKLQVYETAVTILIASSPKISAPTVVQASTAYIMIGKFTLNLGAVQHHCHPNRGS